MQGKAGACDTLQRKKNPLEPSQEIKACSAPIFHVEAPCGLKP